MNVGRLQEWYQEYKTDFRANLQLAYPIMLGQLGQITTNLADNIMVGRLGAAPLAAVSLSVAIFVIFAIVGLGISFGLPPLVAEADARGRLRRISQFFKHSLVINLSYGIVACVIMLSLAPNIEMFGQDKEVSILAKPYLLICAWTFIPMMIFQTLRCYSDGMSQTKAPMIAMLIGNVANIVLNYMLIYGHWGAPEMGVSGAALGTLIARVTMIVSIIILLINWNDLWYPIRHANYGQYKAAFFRKIVNISVPISLQMLFEVGAVAGVAILMGRLGKEAQAAHQIAINLAAVPFMLCAGLGMAASVRVGNQLGLRSQDGMRKAGYSAFWQVTAFMSCTAIVFALCREYLPYLYIKDAAVVEMASTLLIFAAIFQIPDGLQVVALGALRGSQDVYVPTLICFLAYWILGLPLGSYLAFQTDMGPIGFWVGLVIGFTIAAILLLSRFKRIVSRLS